MEKTTLICLMVSMLLTATVLPAVGDPIRSEVPLEGDSGGPWSQAPVPAYCPTPRHDQGRDVSSLYQQQQKAPVVRDEVVVSMIEQVDTDVYLSYLENLTADGPRPTESPNCIATAQFIYDEFVRFGLDVRYHHWTNSGYEADNVEATLHGTDESSDDLYIICAHYDTTVTSPGADDDTSGTIAVLLAAMIMSQYQFNHTIKFVGFSGEEQGLLGSQVYASEAVSQGWDIIGVLNLDMVSYAITTTDGDNVITWEDTQSEWLYAFTAAVCAQYTEYIQLAVEHGGYHWGSDHNSFWDEGFSAIDYFEHTKSPYYHTSQDTIEHVNTTYAVKNIRLALATLAELAEGEFISNPPAKPELSGPVVGGMDISYSFTVVSSEPDGEDVYYFIDWGDGTDTGWIGPYSPGTEQTEEKSWPAEATYIVRAQAKDINEISSDWSDPISVSIIDDTPPGTPAIDGQKRGKVGTSYTFTVSTSDVEADEVYYLVDWGDGQVDDWVGPFASGASAEVEHTWDKKGTFIVKVKAKDIHGLESGWGSMSVTMPTESLVMSQGFLAHLFKVFPHAFPVLRFIVKV